MLSKVSKLSDNIPHHESILHIDRNDAVAGFYNDLRYENTSDVVRQQISHIGVKSYYFDVNIPNVNTSNNIVSFVTSTSGGSVSLVPGFYTVPQLMAHLQVRLNSLSGSSFVTFTVTSIGNGRWTVVGTNGFRFLPSTHLNKAAPLTGLFVTPDLTTTMTVVARGVYTRYIDVTIDELKTGQVLINTFSKNRQFSDFGHLIRVPIYNPLTLVSNTEFVVDEDIDNIHYSRVRKRNLKSFQIRLYDEFGELLDVETQNIAGTDYEVSGVDYKMTISTKSITSGV